MLKKSNIKLKKLIWILICISILTLSLIQLFYYYGYYSTLLAKSQSDTTEVIYQLEETLNNYAYKIDEIGNYITFNSDLQTFVTSSDAYERYVLMDSIVNSMNYLGDSSSIIKNILFIDKKHNTLSKNPTFDSQLIQYVNDNYPFSDEKLFDNTYMYIKSTSSSPGTLVYLKPVIYYKEIPIYEKAGTLIITFNLDNLTPLLSASKLSQTSQLFIIDSNDIIITSNSSHYNGQSAPQDILTLKNRQESQIVEYLGKKTLVYNIKLENFNWLILSLVPINELTADFTPYFITGIAFLVIISLLLVSGGYILTKQISTPISQIISEMQLMNNTTKYPNIRINSKNEIGELANYINEMINNKRELSNRIFHTQKRLYEMELIKKETELSTLQNQINPHFLYNTLECIRGIALYYDVKEIDTIVSNMSSIFRYNIKGSEIVSLSDEINCVEKYLEIISIRFNNKILSKITIKPEIYQSEILKFILQPIVENSVHHGLEGKLLGGLITIHAWIDKKDTINISIKDNGCGIDNIRLKSLNDRLSNATELQKTSNGSIGLSNINLRIKTFYGKLYGLEIFSDKNIGTEVIIRIPQKPNVLSNH